MSVFLGILKFVFLAVAIFSTLMYANYFIIDIIDGMKINGFENNRIETVKKYTYIKFLFLIILSVSWAAFIIL